jgi:capsule polysaccharide export protein KpsE/RkpR
MDNNSQLQSVSDGVYFFAILIKYKVFIIIMTFLSAIGSVILAFLLPVWYASTVNFVPPQESASSSSVSGGLSAVMKDFGLSKVGGNKSNEYTMLVFLESRSVVDSIMKKYDIVRVYDMEDIEYSLVRKAFQENVLIKFLDEGNYEITV